MATSREPPLSWDRTRPLAAQRLQRAGPPISATLTLSPSLPPSRCHPLSMSSDRVSSEGTEWPSRWAQRSIESPQKGCKSQGLFLSLDERWRC